MVGIILHFILAGCGLYNLTGIDAAFGQSRKMGGPLAFFNQNVHHPGGELSNRAHVASSRLIDTSGCSSRASFGSFEPSCMHALQECRVFNRKARRVAQHRIHPT